MKRLLPTVAAVFATIAIGCGSQESAEDVARELEGNVEKSAEVMKDTYDQGRKEGEGAVEAAGDAYEKVLEEGTAKDHE